MGEHSYTVTLKQARDGYVWVPAFRDPVTVDQYEQAQVNEEVARALVCDVALLDLEHVAEGLR